MNGRDMATAAWCDTLVSGLVTWTDLDFHHDLLHPALQGLARQPASVPHVLMYGPPGSGKRTRIRCWLRDLYGPEVLTTLRPETRVMTFAPVSQASVTMPLLTSRYHLELRPADAGEYDRMVVQLIIKDLATSATVTEAPVPYRVLVLRDVDALTHEAQAALRRTMEQYVNTCRLVLVAHQLTQIIEPLRSRCLVLRCPAPTQVVAMQALRQTEARCAGPGTALADEAWRQAWVAALHARAGLEPLNFRHLILQTEGAYRRAWARGGASAVPALATEPPWIPDVDEALDELATWVWEAAHIPVADPGPGRPRSRVRPTPDAEPSQDVAGTLLAATLRTKQARTTAARAGAATGGAHGTPPWVPSWLLMRSRLYELLGQGVTLAYILQGLLSRWTRRGPPRPVTEALARVLATSEAAWHRGQKAMLHAETAVAQAWQCLSHFPR